MADAINGYRYDFSVYTGAIAGRETALGEKVVLTLSESIMGCHHKLFLTIIWQYLFGGLDHWTGILDWTTGLTLDLIYACFNDDLLQYTYNCCIKTIQLLIS